MNLNTLANLQIIQFESPQEWEGWLAENHASAGGLWLRFFKKASGRDTVTYSDALDAALCYGWIDGQTKKYDELSYLQKFTPRRPRSVWSKLNTGRVERLIESGRMTPAGLKEVEAAKLDGRWERAYDPPSKIAVPDDFLEELSKSKKAKAFFDTLDKINTRTIAWRLQTANKPETRERRMKAIIEMLERGEKLYG